MFTLLKKAVGYVFSENNVENKCQYDVAGAGSKENEKQPILRRNVIGKVTHLRTGYGLIDGHIYFNFDTVDKAQMPTVGATVSVDMVGTEDGGWRALFVAKSEDWGDEDASNKEPIVVGDNKTVLGKITQINGMKGILNHETHFELTHGCCDFVPVEGDWVTLSGPELNNGFLSVVSVKPLRKTTMEGSITLLRREFGVVDDEIYFSVDAIDNGYIAKQGDEVRITAIESAQRRLGWRAISLVPKSAATVHKKNSVPRKKYGIIGTGYVKYLLQDKENVTVTPLVDFGILPLNQNGSIVAIIRNHGIDRCTYYGCRMQGTQTEVFSLGNTKIIRNATETEDGHFIIMPEGSMSVTVNCQATYLGRLKQLMVFEFEGFLIGRHVTATVQDCYQSSLNPTQPYRSQTRKGKTVENKDGSFVLPGERPCISNSSPRQLPISMPQYEIPKKLWSCVQEGSELLDCVPSLAQPLSKANYVMKMQTLLHLEEIQMITDMQQYDMSQVTLVPEKDYLSVTVPGLAEGRPSLLLGDKVLLSHTHPQHGSPLFEGYIHEVSGEEIFIKFHRSFHDVYNDELVDISFQINRTSLRRCHQAVNLAMRVAPEIVFPHVVVPKLPRVVAVERLSTCSHCRLQRRSLSANLKESLVENLTLSSEETSCDGITGVMEEVEEGVKRTNEPLVARNKLTGVKYTTKFNLSPDETTSVTKREDVNKVLAVGGSPEKKSVGQETEINASASPRECNDEQNFGRRKRVSVVDRLFVQKSPPVSPAGFSLSSPVEKLNLNSPKLDSSVGNAECEATFITPRGEVSVKTPRYISSDNNGQLVFSGHRGLSRKETLTGSIKTKLHAKGLLKSVSDYGAGDSPMQGSNISPFMLKKVSHIDVNDELPSPETPNLVGYGRGRCRGSPSPPGYLKALPRSVSMPSRAMASNRVHAVLSADKCPCVCHGNQSPENASSQMYIKWSRPDLNERQKAAVRRILGGLSRPTPYIVFGPPGTGKTITIVEAIVQLLKLCPDCRILACTPSNSAADLITERILESKSVDASLIVRLNAFQRSSNIPDSIRMCCSDGDNLPLIVRHRLVISTCTTAGLLYSLGLSHSHFTHVFVDEAGQATEPECMVPMQFASQDGQVILAGDPNQLGAVLRSKFAVTYGLQASFIERLMKSELYSRDEERFMDHGCYDPLVVTKLVNNYRSHGKLLELPSATFYHSELVVCAPGFLTDRCLNFDFLPKKGLPLVFHGVAGEDSREGNSPSWFNPTEVMQVIRYLRLLYRYELKPNDIGIITPYRKQVEKLHRMMDLLDIPQPKVGSVEEFQGQERLVVIISTVRSNMKLLEFDSIFNLGFLSNPKRFNVAVTRAQALLITIGNPFILSNDQHWCSLLNYCMEAGAYVGCKYPVAEDI